MRLRLWTLLFSLLLASPACANPLLPHVIGDHMVLQQGRDVRLWGWADAGERIRVSMLGHTQATVADPGGRWQIALPPAPVGGPYTITIAGKATITLRDVLVGEVWVASGQSNMSFALHTANGGDEAIRQADLPGIRFFTVPRHIASAPQTNTQDASWQVSTPETAGEFSAVAFFFARHLHHKLAVPIGILHTSWPGTAAEEWTNPASLGTDPRLQPIHKQWQSMDRTVDEHPPRFDVQFDGFELLSDSGATPYSKPAPGGPWIYDWHEAPDTTFEVVPSGHSGSGYCMQVSGSLDHAHRSLLRTFYAPDHSAVDMSQYTGVRFWVRGNGNFRVHSLQSDVVDWDNYVTLDPLHATPEWRAVTIQFKDLRQSGWGKLLPFNAHLQQGFMIECEPTALPGDRPPGGLYLGMITPLTRYPIRGAIWYQGESNGDRGWQYQKLLPTMITDWRKAWNEGPFPFLIVQLPNYGPRQETPAASNWAEVREAQAMTSTNLPATGLAVTIDLGAADDVHPHRKVEVGDRLALRALDMVYHEPGVSQGPVYQSMRIEDNHVRVTFSQKLVGSPVKGFAVAGADQKFYWADATLDGDSVILSSPSVPAPVSVRYAWGDNPDCTLVNPEGLPAAPFRTDDWPLTSNR